MKTFLKISSFISKYPIKLLKMSKNLLIQGKKSCSFLKIAKRFASAIHRINHYSDDYSDLIANIPFPLRSLVSRLQFYTTGPVSRLQAKYQTTDSGHYKKNQMIAEPLLVTIRIVDFVLLLSLNYDKTSKSQSELFPEVFRR